jgi:hypothetical protein
MVGSTSKNSRENCSGFVPWDGKAAEAGDEPETVKAAKSLEERWELAEESKFDDSNRDAAGNSLPAGQKPGAVCAETFGEQFELPPW